MQIHTPIPKDPDIHLLAVSSFTNKHAKALGWLALPPRSPVHFTSTFASWFNLVERRYWIISQRAIRPASASAKDLISTIEQVVAVYPNSMTPFNSTAMADSILEMRQRLCS